jgi:hypothetical protein
LICGTIPKFILNPCKGNGTVAIVTPNALRCLAFALLIEGAWTIQANAQLLCYTGCSVKMIDYSRALALDNDSNEWHPAQITQTLVSWQYPNRIGALTRYFSLDRYSGRVTEKMIHHPPYTNPPYYGESQCRKVECPGPPPF